MKESLERINEMEKILDDCTEALEVLHGALERMENLQDDMGQLFAYYGSELWFDDRELELPPDTKAGVLSEDLLYDAIIDARDAAFRMLELGTDILRNRI